MLRKLIGWGLLSAVLWMAAPADVVLAQDKFPSKTITWLIPYGPGGGFDLHSRAMVPGLKKALGVNIIIRNRPGAGGNLAWAAKPDGYTISTVNIPGAIVSELFDEPKPQYRLKEFSWIGQISAAPYIFAAGVKTPFHKPEDLRKAKEVLITGTGVGGTAWVTEVLTAGALKFKHRFILGYPSAPASNMGIVRGEGHARALGLDSPGQMQFIHDGHLRPLWVYLEKRAPAFPNVPTVGELGHPELTVLASHRVVTAPPGMPKDRLEILQNAFNAATKDPDVLARFAQMKARIEPVVGQEWVDMLNGFYDLIQDNAEVVKKSLKK